MNLAGLASTFAMRMHGLPDKPRLPVARPVAAWPIARERATARGALASGLAVAVRRDCLPGS